MVHDFVLETSDVWAFERFSQGNQLVQDDSHCPDVSLIVVREVEPDLRRHKVWSTAGSLCHLSLRGQLFRDSEVSKFEHTILDEDVLSLDVSVENLLAVKSEKRKGNLSRVHENLVV